MNDPTMVRLSGLMLHALAKATLPENPILACVRVRRSPRQDAKAILFEATNRHMMVRLHLDRRAEDVEFEADLLIPATTIARLDRRENVELWPDEKTLRVPTLPAVFALKICEKFPGTDSAVPFRGARPTTGCAGVDCRALGTAFEIARDLDLERMTMTLGLAMDPILIVGRSAWGEVEFVAMPVEQRS